MSTKAIGRVIQSLKEIQTSYEYLVIYIIDDALYEVSVAQKTHEGVFCWVWLPIFSEISLLLQFFFSIALGPAGSSMPARKKRLKSISVCMPWTIPTTLLVLWGVVWMFKGPSDGSPNHHGLEKHTAVHQLADGIFFPFQSTPFDFDSNPSLQLPTPSLVNEGEPITTNEPFNTNGPPSSFITHFPSPIFLGEPTCSDELPYFNGPTSGSSSRSPFPNIFALGESIFMDDPINIEGPASNPSYADLRTNSGDNYPGIQSSFLTVHPISSVSVCVTEAASFTSPTRAVQDEQNHSLAYTEVPSAEGHPEAGQGDDGNDDQNDSNGSQDNQSNGEAKPWKCDICQKEFRHIRYLQRHRHTHEPPKLACQIFGCSYRTRRQHNLDRHVTAVHSTQNQLQQDNTDSVSETPDYGITTTSEAPAESRKRRRGDGYTEGQLTLEDSPEILDGDRGNMHGSEAKMEQRRMEKRLKQMEKRLKQMEEKEKEMEEKLKGMEEKSSRRKSWVRKWWWWS